MFVFAVPTLASAFPALTADRSDSAADLLNAEGAGRPFVLTRTSAHARALRATPVPPTRSVTRYVAVVSGPSAHTAGSSTGSGRADWQAIAACESGGNWAANTGNGYWGGLQFAPGTWFGNGGGPFDGSGPFPYSAGQQIAVAERVLASQGPGAWPHCFRWA